MHRSLAWRLVAGAAVWIAVALGIAGAGLSELFDHHVAAAYEHQLGRELGALAATLEWNADGSLQLTRRPADPLFERPYSGRYWQAAAGNGVVLRSRSLWDTELALPAEAETPGALHRHVIDGPDGQSLLLIERTVALPGNPAPVRLALAQDRSEIREAGSAFTRLLAAALAVLAAGLILAVLAQIAFGLWPLKRLRQALAGLRDRRQPLLEGEWPREVQPLVDEINTLLDHDAAVLARTRRQAADLAHALKTPLAVIANEAARPEGPSADEVRRQADAMRRQVERHLARARAAGAGLQRKGDADAVSAIRELARTLARLHQERRIAIAVRGTGRFAGDRQDLTEMLGNVLDNAFQWAASRVDVSVESHGSLLSIHVDDDGPGVSDAERPCAVQPYTRLDEAAKGSGLGLAITSDIAALYGGQLGLERSALGGLRVCLTLPAATASSSRLTSS